ncbi:two-component sensor histidine kinase [Desulfuromonas versatilis]|uniref:histidine kinase n=1 Tax=Desulfuromonas versatilis TaxID=2802975 RepID=A0ABN6E646_9BACT|nr:two-component sensor histidine kinase [Desulfuromonas versatilis]
MRIAAGYSLLTLLSFLVLMAIGYGFLAANLARGEREQVSIELQSLRERYLAGGVPAFEALVLANDRFRRNNPFFTRIDGWAGEVPRVYFPQYWREFDLTPLERLPAGMEGRWLEVVSPGQAHRLEVLCAELPDGFRFQVGISTEDRGAVLRRLRETFLFAALPLLALGLAGGALLAQRSLRPVRDLVQTVESIKSGRWEARAPRSGNGDELDDLGRLFNEMIERINQLIRGMKGALDSVAHDLRTPMTRFRNRAEEALQRGPDSRACQGALQASVEESEQILRMLGMLMDISEAETGTLRLSLREVDVSALAENLAEMYGMVGEEKAVAVETRIAPGIRWALDPERVSQALANLLDNAVKYTPAGGRVELSLEPAEGGLRIRVADTGPGIDPGDLERIWERLYRGRHDSAKGLGLGLSLVRAVAVAHGGQARGWNRPEGGALFELTLPVSASLSKM